MPELNASILCLAQADKVWKLLHDPRRFPDWWAGVARVEASADGHVARYMAEWPDFEYPTRVETSADGGRIVISCLISDIAHEWRLEPAPEGCRVRARVVIPDDESHRAAALSDELDASLSRLAEVAEREP
ncbi:MAG: SRPBCC family protein [Actinobacteria bacterium]|nr:SRPBCC family protein [Actinomycetota bacterium]